MKDVLFLTGCEDFSAIIEKNAYYVDKTAYLKNLFMSTSEVMNSLFIRPRRFGKTLNMRMIEAFCRINYQNPGDKSYQHRLFLDNGRNLAVAADEYQELRDKVMGEFPVISISFKGVEGNTFSSAVSSLLGIISDLYERFLFLRESSRQSAEIKERFSYIYGFSTTKFSGLKQSGNLDEAVDVCSSFIPTLAQMLFREYGKQVLVLIDEYDVPLQKAVIAKEPYYDEMLEIVRKISVTTFKQNPDPWLYKGIVTGCLRIAHQSVFTDANNFTTYGMTREPYTGFFGFTEDETLKLLSDCGLDDKEKDVKEWYDGYRFGQREIYCPWSLVSYADAALHGGNDRPQPFWVNTSGNDLISMFTRNSMEAKDAVNISKLQQLLDGDIVPITLKEFTTYPDIRSRVSFDVFMTLMLHTGYVTYADDSDFLNDVKIRIPNKEVLSCFREKQEDLYGENNPYWFNQAMTLVDLLLENKTEESQELITTMLKEFLSIRNSGSELYYHGFMTGVLGLACAVKGVDFHEEIESGSGFPDVVIKMKSARTAVVLEFKKGKSELSDLIDSADYATGQIIDEQYAEPYIKEQYSKVYGIGIGFGGKDCVVKSLGNMVQKNGS